MSRCASCNPRWPEGWGGSGLPRGSDCTPASIDLTALEELFCTAQSINLNKSGHFSEAHQNTLSDAIKVLQALTVSLRTESGSRAPSEPQTPTNPQSDDHNFHACSRDEAGIQNTKKGGRTCASRKLSRNPENTASMLLC